jgi:hypothetical protein
VATLEEDVAKNRVVRDNLEAIPEVVRTEKNWIDLAYYRDLVSRGEAMLTEAREREEHPSFQQELERLINKHCLENRSATPDFVLAQYIVGCLDVWEKTVIARDKWYSFEPWTRAPLEAPK